MIKLSDYIFIHLANHGVRHAFMIVGGGAMHLNDSLGRTRQIEYICNLHEQAAAIAAEGYYRTSGRLPVVSVTSGPGGTNALTGVIGQWLDSIPAIYVSGQVKQQTTIASCPELDLRQLGDQEINIVDIVRPVTKYATMVRNPQEIRYHLDKAVYLATHGRPGPVWIDLPLDIQSTMVDDASLIPYDPQEDEARFEVAKIKQQVSDLLERIRKAIRPVILAGHGIRLAGVADLFIELVDRLKVPVLTAICGHDLVWSDHPLFFGRPGICGDRLGNFVIQNSDVMLAIGARLGIRQIGYNYDAFARSAFRAMVDIDDAELNKPMLRLDMPIHADARFFIEEMLSQLSNKKLSIKTDWIAWCADRKCTLPDIITENPHRPEYISSYEFADVLFKQLMPGDVVVTGVGTSFRGTFQVMQIKKGVRVFTNLGCATMGYDLPAAIGACFAIDRKPVVLITGDGSIQMNIQELQTIVGYKLPIKIFVINNNGYLAIRTTQDAYFKGRHFGSNPEGKLYLPNICKVAEAYGIPVVKMRGGDSIVDKIQEVLRLLGPCLCEISMDPKQTLYPKLSSIVKCNGDIVSSPLEDMYPFLDREEFKKGMIVKPIDE